MTLALVHRRSILEQAAHQLDVVGARCIHQAPLVTAAVASRRRLLLFLFLLLRRRLTRLALLALVAGGGGRRRRPVRVGDGDARAVGLQPADAAQRQRSAPAAAEMTGSAYALYASIACDRSSGSMPPSWFATGLSL